MKKIVVYSTQLLPTGGIESHLLEFCQKMSDKSVIIDLIVLNSRIPPATEELYRAKCRNVFLGKNKSSAERLIWLVSVAFRLKFNQYDALYTNGQGESIGVLPKLLRIKGTWVHHHHTAGDKEDQATWGSNYIGTLKKADTVIACSHRNALEMSAALSRTIDTIPCLSREIEVEPLPLTKNGKIKLGYYGRLIPEKGIDLLCKLSEEPALGGVEFHIWGKGEAYPFSYFENFPRVRYHGPFSGVTELKKVLGLLDGFLLLSVHPEGLPISLLEVMSAGTPWLATDRGGVPDIACDPVSTRVIPANSDYEQIKKSVELFAADLAAGKISKETQKRLYAEKFSAPAVVQRWKEALKLNLTPN
ncbi:glycosyltransferase family 4 protein [Rufibacter aurantiacus]|uniref:glycosyltransferase family 4 protein n=1 Tax=Rufibacter aurantiacus TaxID=2817374 RepID=UPI001B30A9CB|nr:glycosyltransferase family 4 protein [Rufibacter aurantiacus]